METRTETGTWAGYKTLLLAGSETVWATLTGGRVTHKVQPHSNSKSHITGIKNSLCTFFWETT